MSRRNGKTRLEFCSVCLDRKRPEILRGGVCPTCQRDLMATVKQAGPADVKPKAKRAPRDSGQYKATGAWSSSTGTPRWGRSKPETRRNQQEWANRVGQTPPTPLRKCKPCGGWATRNCTHGGGA